LNPQAALHTSCPAKSANKTMLPKPKLPVTSAANRLRSLAQGWGKEPGSGMA